MINSRNGHNELGIGDNLLSHFIFARRNGSACQDVISCLPKMFTEALKEIFWYITLWPFH